MKATPEAGHPRPPERRADKPSWRWWVAMALVTSVAAVLRWHPDESDVPGRTFQRADEVHYVDLVRQFMNGEYRVSYFINPTAYAYVLHGVTAVVGGVRVALGLDASSRDFVIAETLHPHAIVLAGRVLTMLMGIACVPLLASIGRSVGSRSAGILAALLLAVDQTAVLRSHLCGNEIPMLLAGLLSFRCLVGAESGNGLRRGVLTGLFAGIAAAMKYSGGVFILPPLLTLGRRAPVVALSAAVGFFAATPSILLDARAFLRGFTTQYAYLHGGYFASDVSRGEHGWIYYLRNFPSMNVGVVFSWIALAGVAYAIFDSIRRRDHARHPSLWIVLPTYALLGSGIFCDMRFLLPAIPFILLLGAQLVDRVATRLRLPPTLTLLVSAAILAHPAWATAEEARRQFGRPDWRAEVLPFLDHTAGPAHRVVDFVSKPTERWFDEADPWTALGLELPSDAGRVDAVRARLVSAGRLLPSTSLHALFKSNASLAALKASFASHHYDRLVISIPARFAGGNLEPMVENIVPLRYLLQNDYWKDAFLWFSTFPIVDTYRAANGAMFVCTLEVPREVREGK